MSEMGGTPTYGHLSKDNDDEPNAMKNPVYQPFHRTQFHKPLYWDGLWHWVYHIHDLINQWMELGGFPVHTCSDWVTLPWASFIATSIFQVKPDDHEWKIQKG